MKAQHLIALNAILAIAVGIAFALYGPLTLAVFGTPDVQGTSGPTPETPTVEYLLYWTVASFARMFGALLFGFGILLWSVRTVFLDSNSSAETRRGILFAGVLANGMAAFVATTQQFSIWNSTAGLAVTIFFILLTLAYIFSLARAK